MRIIVAEVGGSFVGYNKPIYGYFLVLCIVAVSFFSTIVLNQRSYQDTWVLDGIVVPTAIFVFFFIVAETFIQENKKAVVLAAFFLAAINLIPGLKYRTFCGCFDTPAHFRFTNEIVSLGYIPENEYFSEIYGSNPGMHIFMSCVSIISGISTNEVLRFIIPALSGLVPFMIYFITKDILDNNLQRYVIIASSFPIVQRYITYGTSLAILPYFLLIASFLHYVFTETNRGKFWLIFVILSFNLITSHAITSIFVSLILIGMLLILKSLEIAGKKLLGGVQTSLLIVPSVSFVILHLTWWMNVATFNLFVLSNLIQSLFVGEMKATVPAQFHKIPLLPQLQVLAVFHLRDAIIGMLSLFGLFVFLRELRRKELSDRTKTFYMYLIVLLSTFVLFLCFQFVSGFGTIQYQRFIAYAMPLCAFLVGLTLWRLNKFLHDISVKSKIRNLAFSSFLFILVSSCLIQFYCYQPLVPRSNVVSRDLPENEYLVYVGVVNTIYQIKMISFAETHSYDGRIASDKVTRYQIFGFSDPTFFFRHIWWSPLETNQNLKWDLFLLHTVEAGPLSELAEYRTREKIENLRLEAGNIIYDNGESFILSHSPHNYNQTKNNTS